MNINCINNKIANGNGNRTTPTDNQLKKIKNR
jgi:hypothetical protein